MTLHSVARHNEIISPFKVIIHRIWQMPFLQFNNFDITHTLIVDLNGGEKPSIDLPLLPINDPGSPM